MQIQANPREKNLPKDIRREEKSSNQFRTPPQKRGLDVGGGRP